MGQRYGWLVVIALVLLVRGAWAAEPAAAAKGKVLMLVAHQDFYYQEYHDPKVELEKAGYQVVVTATQATCTPHPNSGQTGEGKIKTDVLLADVKPADYVTVVIVGGWGASMYQPAFPGTYRNAAYRLPRAALDQMNAIVQALQAAGKPVAAICHGVAALAWCRTPESPVKGKHVCAYQGNGPACEVGGEQVADNVRPTRWHIEQNGGLLATPNSVGDPATDRDDVLVDGKLITAQNYNSAKHFGEVLVAQLAAAAK